MTWQEDYTAFVNKAREHANKAEHTPTAGDQHLRETNASLAVYWSMEAARIWRENNR